MKKFLINAMIIGMISIVCSACISSANSAGLTTSRWKLLSYGPTDNQIKAIPDIDTMLAFNPDGLVTGSMGCNSFGGKYRAAGGQIAFEEITQTLLACESNVLQQETQVMQVFSGHTRFTLESGILTITTEDGGISAIFYAEQ